MAFLGKEDISDLKILVWQNNNTMLPKRDIRNFSAAYNVSYSTVKYRIEGIIACSFQDKHGNWTDECRVTYGKVITQNLMNEVKIAVNNYKTTGIPIDHKAIAKNCRSSENEVLEVIGKMI